MDRSTYDQTRRSLHALAELVVAGPRFRQTGELALRVRTAGFGTREDPVVAVVRGDLVTDQGSFPVDGLSYEQVASRAGLVATRLEDVYADGAHVDPSESVRLDLAAAVELQDALVLGDRALAEFSPDTERLLWPEHFDVSITVDQVDYGVSPGDDWCAEPYAYVGPHQPPSGPFWNAPFGAAQPLSELSDVASVTAFFRDGATRADRTSPQPVPSSPGGER